MIINLILKMTDNSDDFIIIEGNKVPFSDEKSELTCLIIGDPHFKVSNLQETRLMTQKILVLCKERKPDFIICLGDILDRHEIIHMAPFNESTSFLEELSHIAPLYIVIGNHDRPNNSNFLTTEHPFIALKYWKNTFVADNVLEQHIQGKRFLYVPYVPPGRLMEALAKHFKIIDEYKQVQDKLDEFRTELSNCKDKDKDKEKEKEKDKALTEEQERLYDEKTLELYCQLFNPYLENITAIFAHQEFRNAKMGAIKSKEGDLWSPAWPYIISGHIHNFDQLADNILYTGTPLAHAFGDSDDKTISWVTWPLEPTDEFYHGLKHIRIDLKLPRKKILYMSYDEVLKYDPSGDELKNQIKVVIRGSAAEFKVIMKHAHIQALKAKGIRIAFQEEVVQNTKDDNPTKQKQLNRLNFGQRLYRKIYKDEAMKEFFIHNYGHIDEQQLWKLVPKYQVVKK
jgi:DNA repair exonuclease SbcCD nuclease subunit